MGEYAQAAEFYDLLYADIKDHAAEVALLSALIRERNSDAVSLLDVGCGTGSHARAFIDAGFRVDGVDLEPSFVEIAQAKCPEGRFFQGDMTSLDVDSRYDVVTCLFSAIGYVRTEARLRAAIAGMRALLRPHGLLIIDPWFEPGQLTNGWISVAMGKNDDLTVFRMSRTLIEGVESRLEFEYLIGRSWNIERRSEAHTLGLFTQAQMESAFAAAGLHVKRLPEVLRTRGLYLATEGRYLVMSTFIESIRAEYRRYQVLAERALDQVPDELLNTPGFAGGNSLVVIAWHVSGNLRSRFTDFLTVDGEKPWRNREEEFASRVVSRDELETQWESGWKVLLDAIDSLSDDDLHREVTIRGQPLTVLDALHRSLAHVSYHVGQIVYISHAHRGAGWKYLSIAPGGSAAYNAAPTHETPQAHVARLSGQQDQVTDKPPRA